MNRRLRPVLFVPFSFLTLLFWWHEGYPTCKNWCHLPKRFFSATSGKRRLVGIGLFWFTWKRAIKMEVGSSSSHLCSVRFKGTFNREWVISHFREVECWCIPPCWHSENKAQLPQWGFTMHCISWNLVICCTAIWKILIGSHVHSIECWRCRSSWTFPVSAFCIASHIFAHTV